MNIKILHMIEGAKKATGTTVIIDVFRAFSVESYFLFTALSFPFIALYNGGAAIFRSMGNSKVSMFSSLIMNIINISGNALLIFKFQMGAAGAAIATLIARIIGAMIIIHNIFTSVIWPSAFPITNCFRAASDVRYPMVVSITLMWVFRVGCSYLYAVVFGLGLLGVWFAMFTDWTFRATIFITHFLRGKWLEKYKPLESKA